MNVFQGKHQFSRLHTVCVGAAAAISMVLAFSGPAKAQNPDTFVDFSHPNITVDLSVISDGGYQAPRTSATPMFAPPSGRKLLVPGGQAPSSMLHLPTVSGSPLVKPKKAKKVQAVAKKPARKAPAPAPVVAKMPEKKAPPPAPAKVAPPKPVEAVQAPKKLEAPAKPAKAAPAVKAEQKAPPPAPVVKPAPKVAQKKAPETPAPPAAPAAKKAPAKEQAALPASGAMKAGKKLQVAFAADQTKLPEAAKQELIALANSMKGQDKMRLQLMAYAGGPSLTSSLARRMSLSRALSIRAFLIENGVRSTRIDVRALGNKTTEEPLNRVDLNVTER